VERWGCALFENHHKRLLCGIKGLQIAEMNKFLIIFAPPYKLQDQT